MNKPSAIIIGDIHYRDSQPVCRTDDFWETQKRKALWLRGLWEELGRPVVLQPGDVFHHWKSSPQVIRAVLEYLPPMICVAGNHDLPSHNLELYWKSALAVVERANAGWSVGDNALVQLDLQFSITCYAWGETPQRCMDKVPGKYRNVMLAHTTILDGPAMFDGEQASEFLRRIKGCDLIVTGDNHKRIVSTIRNSKENRVLVNPGCFARQSVTEADYEPHVFLWYADKNSLEPVPVPIQPASDVITREHLAAREQRDERIAAFVESLAGEVELGVNFKDNVLRTLQESNVRLAVRERVEEATDAR